jgi:glucose/arabinose dehydrogenase
MSSEPLLDIDVSSIGERGMLGIAIGNKSLEDDSISVYLYYTKPENKSQDDDRNLASNNVYAYKLVNNKLVNPKILLHLSDLHQTQHNGGVVLIGPDDSIYTIVGEGDTYYDGRALKARTQNYKDGTEAVGRGGILRFTQDGLPMDDGILGRSIPLRLYYAYGIRNSFGMDFDPLSGKLWDTENGAREGDEINMVDPGFNSGSKQVQGLASLQSDFSKSNLVTYGGKGHYSDPEFTWDLNVGLTALKFLNSKIIGKEYENDMFVGDFHNGYLYHFDLDESRTMLNTSGTLEDKIVNSHNELHEIVFAEGLGGITDLEVGPDGYLYILSLQQGGENCGPENRSVGCIDYDSGISGTILRIVPKQK